MSELREEFERLRPKLLEEGRRPTGDGADARAMLALTPALIGHFERERKVHVAPEDLFEAMANTLGNVVLHTLRASIAGEAQNSALEVMLAHIRTSVRPLLARTAAGIILPTGARLQ